MPRLVLLALVAWAAAAAPADQLVARWTILQGGRVSIGGKVITDVANLPTGDYTVEMVDWVRPYFGESVVFEEEAAKKFLTPAITPVLGKLLARFEALPSFSKQVWEESFKKFVEEEGIKMGQIAQPVRVALTGRTASPGLFEVMEILGRDRTLLRLRQGIQRASA